MYHFSSQVLLFGGTTIMNLPGFRLIRGWHELWKNISMNMRIYPWNMVIFHGYVDMAPEGRQGKSSSSGHFLNEQCSKPLLVDDQDLYSSLHSYCGLRWSNRGFRWIPEKLKKQPGFNGSLAVSGAVSLVSDLWGPGKSSWTMQEFPSPSPQFHPVVFPISRCGFHL